MMEVETQAVAEAGARNRTRDHHGPLVLGPRDSLVGKLRIEGDLRVQGSAEGELEASGDVQVDASASVQASVSGRNISIRGQVTGQVNAQERLLLAGSSVLSGDVQVGRLAIEDGATLNGHVTMHASRPDRSEKKSEKPEQAAAENQG